MSTDTLLYPFEVTCGLLILYVASYLTIQTHKAMKKIPEV